MVLEQVFLIKTNLNKTFNLIIQYNGLFNKKIVLVSISVLGSSQRNICNIKIKSVKDLLGMRLNDLNSSLSFVDNEKIIEIYELKYIFR